MSKMLSPMDDIERQLQKVRRSELETEARKALKRAIDARSDAGLSDATIAAMVGVAPSTITKWRHGRAVARGLGAMLYLIRTAPKTEPREAA